jgi:hypothetical protein
MQEDDGLPLMYDGPLTLTTNKILLGIAESKACQHCDERAAR